MKLAKIVSLAALVTALAAPALAQGNQQQGAYQQSEAAVYPPTAPSGQSGAYASYPPQDQSPQGGALQGQGAPPRAMSVAQWFTNYDQIRHQAQMSPAERQRADTLLTRGMSVLMPGDEKEATKRLLGSMVARYQHACDQFRLLPQLSQTAFLHRAYFDYFATATQLFSDYLRVEDNLFVSDAATGQPLASSLLQRKQNLEALEHRCKQIDAQTRAQFGIAPYPW